MHEVNLIAVKKLAWKPAKKGGKQGNASRGRGGRGEGGDLSPSLVFPASNSRILISPLPHLWCLPTIK